MSRFRFYTFILLWIFEQEHLFLVSYNLFPSKSFMTAHVSIFHFLWFFWTSSNDVHYDSWLYSRNLWLDNGCNDWQVRVLYSSSKGFASIFNYLGQFVKFRQILVKPTAPQAPRETQLVRSISDRARSSRDINFCICSRFAMNESICFIEAAMKLIF